MTAIAPAPPSARVRATALLPRLALVIAALLATLFTAAAPATAHAALTASDPQDGAVVATAPAQVTLSFSEQVAMGDDSIRVMDPQGKRVDTGELRDMCSGSTIRYGTALHPGLPNGTYTVAWQAVSADSHPISGAFTFSVGAPSATSVTLPDQKVGGGPVGIAYGIARYAAYAGFTVLVGGAAFILLCWRRGAAERPLQKLVVRGWVTLTAATLAMLVLRTPYTGSGKFADAFDLDGLKAVLDTKTGAAFLSRLLLLGAAALFIAVLFGAYARRQKAAAADATGAEDAGDAGDRAEEKKETSDLAFGLGVGGTVVAGGIAATWALAEHASTGIQPAIAMPADILHLLAVAAWLGGLTALLVALRKVPDIEREAVRRFSRVAFISVLVLAVTGVYQSWRQVGSWSALTGTSYGRLLLIKIALVAVLVGIAYLSRKWTARLGEVRAEEPEKVLAGVDVSRETSAGAAGGEAAGTDANTETAADAEADAGAADTDPKRAAQLARQRAAREKARETRVRDSDPGRAGLRRSVLAEAGVAVVLLAVTTVLTSTEPGRAVEKEAGRSGASAPAVPNRPVKITLPFDTGGQNGKGNVRLELDPGRVGANTLHLWADGPDGKPLDLPEVKISFTLPAKEIGPLPLAPDRASAGHWTASGVQLPLAGEWRIDVTVRTSDIDQTTVQKNVKIG
ncbi:copper resistance CopC/CopD family protein [Streptomyces lavendulae]|uniref:copper resistance CopC/CopD family protein n=1 Tax=Streptomyces lavendulae TaxID=1914 RepID=UPI0024A574E6|nr:copper resistance protein CopC [Streptomyces lavendulae]GLX21806.1 transport integral membrane protein [Streptomyces lavendulae subsp. lavendulae]GLX28439.1 transport integral membrane protein [Streptomyces lavendulae subsp. lavendulae]